jgi:hypothetical protein
MTKYPALFSFGKEHILSALHTWLLYIGCRKFLIVSDKWMNYSMHPMKTIGNASYLVDLDIDWKYLFEKSAFVCLHPWLWCNDVNGFRVFLMMLIFPIVLSIL